MMYGFLPLAHAQEITRQQSYWVRAYFQYRWKETWTAHWELDQRRLMQPDQQLQFISHLHFHRRVGAHWEGSLGASFSYANAIPEGRLFQEGHWNYPLGKWLMLNQRFRTEQRVFRQADGWADRRFRVRYRLQLGVPMRQWVFKTSNEVMWENRQFDQNRWYVAAEYAFSTHFSTEIGYMAYWQKRREDHYIDRDIFRITAFFKH